MRTLLLTLLLLISSLNAHANHFSAVNSHCEWLGNAGSVIAQNRDQGMSETDMTSNYLKQQQSYEDQLTIIPLIDRVYDKQKKLTPDEIAFVEQRLCVIAMGSYIQELQIK